MGNGTYVGHFMESIKLYGFLQCRGKELMDFFVLFYFYFFKYFHKPYGFTQQILTHPASVVYAFKSWQNLGLRPVIVIISCSFRSVFEMRYEYSRYDPKKKKK